MFDSDQIFAVCVEPPTQAVKGSSIKSMRISFLRDENDDEWVRRAMSGGSLSRG